VWNYEWDAENRLRAMWPRPEVATVMLGSGIEYWPRIEFAYDFTGRRIAKNFFKSQTDPATVTDKNAGAIVWAANGYQQRFVYDGWTPVLSYQVSPVDHGFVGLMHSFAWGPDLSGVPGGAGGIGGLAVEVDEQAPVPGYSDPGPMFPVYDGNGNVTRLCKSDANVTVAAAYEYGPFGEVRSIAGQEGQRNPIRWSTKWTDVESGLVYYGYRYYSASAGRWLNRDPIGEQGGANLNGFVHNSPISSFDPWGWSTFDSSCNACSRGSSGNNPPRWTAESLHESALRLGGVSQENWARLGSDIFGLRGREERETLAGLYRSYAVTYSFRSSKFLWSGAAAVAGKDIVGVVAQMQGVDGMWTGSPIPPGADFAGIRRMRLTLETMAKEIFRDLAWQHQAYLRGGIGELRAHADQGEIDDTVFFDGWCAIHEGRVSSGNRVFLDREQRGILQPYYETFPTWAHGFMSVMARSPLSNAHDFRRVVPNGNITNFDDRWRWVNDHIFSRWVTMSGENRAWEILFALQSFYTP